MFSVFYATIPDTEGQDVSNFLLGAWLKLSCHYS